jgi:Skp family chaperone for outer membrane proteins
VRVFGKTVCATSKALSLSMALSVAATGFLTPTLASAQDGHKVAVIDVAYIFKNHTSIKAEVAKVEAELKSFDAELSKKRDELQQAAAELKTFKPGSPEYSSAEEAVASMESRLRLDMARKRKELSDAEAKIYFENYQRIAAGVKFLANHYKINIVLRYNSEEMNLEQGESVIRGVMKNIVYHDESLDMTNAVMQYLDQTMRVAGKPGAAAAR